MSVWMTIWVVLMILWLFGGSFIAYDGQTSAFNVRSFGGYTLIPWACVLILGLILFGAVSGGDSHPLR